MCVVFVDPFCSYLLLETFKFNYFCSTKYQADINKNHSNVSHTELPTLGLKSLISSVFILSFPRPAITFRFCAPHIVKTNKYRIIINVINTYTHKDGAVKAS